MERIVYVYGESSDDEILTTWMVNNGKPGFVTPDVSGQVENEETIPANAIGVTCTKPIKTILSLTKIVPDADCRRLHNQRYA